MLGSLRHHRAASGTARRARSASRVAGDTRGYPSCVVGYQELLSKLLNEMDGLREELEEARPWASKRPPTFVT